MRYIIYVVSALALAGCVSLGPSDWSPMSHMQVMRACRALCHPHGVEKYDPMDGSCTCAATVITAEVGK